MVPVMTPVLTDELSAVPLKQSFAVGRSPVATAIRIDNLSLSYPAGRKQRKNILNHINLDIAAGEFVVVLGETGCGKSSLLRMLLGQEMPTAGAAFVDGQQVRRVGANCGYVPQKYSLFPDRTVLENMTAGPETAAFHVLGRLKPGFRAFRRRTRAEALDRLAQMGLHASDADKYPHQLSGGMQQRVAIGQTLMMNPRILLMDEAFSALDPATRASLQRMLRSTWLRSRPTVVFVTHNTAEALYLATRIIVLARNGHGGQSGAQVALDLKLPSSGMSLKQDGQKFLDLADQIEDASAQPSEPERCLECDVDASMGKGWTRP